MGTYKAWRIRFQDSEQAARVAYGAWCATSEALSSQSARIAELEKRRDDALRLANDLDRENKRLRIVARTEKNQRDTLAAKADAGKMIARPVGDGSGAYLIEPVPADRADPGPSTTACDDQHAPDPEQPPRRGSIGPGSGKVPRDALRFTSGDILGSDEKPLWEADILVISSGFLLADNVIACRAPSEQGARALRERVLEALCGN